ncbi:MAG: beta-galactosidase [Phycisphaerales bacterium]
MPSVTFDGQSLSVKGRRVWLSACELDYALVPAPAWRRHLEAAAAAGFNAIVSSCPWSLHEPRPGRWRFDGGCDVASFVRLCSELNLWLVLKIGPVVGGTHDGGGLPAWLSDVAGIRLREPNAVFFDRVTRWYHALAERIAPLQASERGPIRERETGPIVAVQIEDDWACGDSKQAQIYFNELVRFAREVGLSVPLLTANQSWTSVDAVTDTWTGWVDLSATVRQLAHLEPERPRIVTVRDPARDRFLGEAAAAPAGGHEHLLRLACTLAAGGQFVVGDAFSTVHRDAPTGRRGGRFHASVAREGSMFDAALAPRECYAPIHRIASFASSFGHVFAQADVGHQAVVVEPEHALGVTAISLAGAGGTAVFVFTPHASRSAQSVPLLLRDGRRMNAHIGNALVTWFLLDVDLFGLGVLDHSSIPPVAFLDRKYLVFVGTAGFAADISIDGVPINMRVPTHGAGARPTIEKRRDLVIVVCNDAQFDGLRLVNGVIECAVGGKRVRIDRDGSASSVVVRSRAERREEFSASVAWSKRVAAPDLVAGTSQRFAFIPGPATLAACGDRHGCGWYRTTFRRSSAGTVSIVAPSVGDRATLWLDGKRVATIGAHGDRFPIDVKVAAGEHVLVAFVERLGRPCAGEHVGRRVGLFGAMFDVKPIRSHPRRVRNASADPFALRGFVYHASRGDVGSGAALEWKVTIGGRGPLIVDHGLPEGVTGTLLVDGAPVARISEDGVDDLAIVLDAVRAPGLANGAVVARLVFDGDVDEKSIARASKSVRFFEAKEAIGAAHAFARWDPPRFDAPTDRPVKGVPLWSHGVVRWTSVPTDLWLDVAGFSDGSLFVNGEACGRFMRRGGSGGTRLFVPRESLRVGTNEFAIFDLDGAAPTSSSLSTRSGARSS